MALQRLFRQKFLKGTRHADAGTSQVRRIDLIEECIRGADGKRVGWEEVGYRDTLRLKGTDW